jgi:hypothetical protein
MSKLNLLDDPPVTSLGPEIRRPVYDLNPHFPVPPAFDYRNSEVTSFSSPPHVCRFQLGPDNSVKNRSQILLSPFCKREEKGTIVRSSFPNGSPVVTPLSKDLKQNGTAGSFR